MKTLVIGGLAALAIGGVAMAQDGPRGPRANDADGDGRISQAEFMAGALQRFDSRDANNDGALTAEEAQANREARRAERRDQMFQRMDANSDGIISRAEFDARAEARGDGRRGRGGWGHGGRGGRGGHGAGVEADGVTRAEAETRAAARFARMDSNNDGFLSQEDRQGRRGDRRRGGSE